MTSSPPHEPTRQNLLDAHQSLCEAAFELMKRKNADYADDDSPFGNLDLVEALSRGAYSTELGIVIRLGDKLSRLMTSTRRDLQVTDESIYDTILDIINYAILFQVKHLARGVTTWEFSKVQDPHEPWPEGGLESLQEQAKSALKGLKASTVTCPWPEGTPPLGVFDEDDEDDEEDLGDDFDDDLDDEPAE